MSTEDPAELVKDIANIDHALLTVNIGLKGYSFINGIKHKV